MIHDTGKIIKESKNPRGIPNTAISAMSLKDGV